MCIKGCSYYSTSIFLQIETGDNGCHFREGEKERSPSCSLPGMLWRRIPLTKKIFFGRGALFYYVSDESSPRRNVSMLLRGQKGFFGKKNEFIRPHPKELWAHKIKSILTIHVPRLVGFDGRRSRLSKAYNPLMGQRGTLVHGVGYLRRYSSLKRRASERNTGLEKWNCFMRLKVCSSRLTMERGHETLQGEIKKKKSRKGGKGW